MEIVTEDKTAEEVQAEVAPVVAEIVAAVVADLPEDPAEITPEMAVPTLDPEAEQIDNPDNVAAVELVMAVEEEFAITIPDEDAATLTTVAEVTEFVTAAVMAPAEEEPAEDEALDEEVAA